MQLRIENTTVITCDASGACAVWEGYDIMVDGPTIAQLVPTGSVPADPAQDEDIECIDGKNHVVIPGLINTHHHLYQSLTRCLPAVQSAKLFDWLTELYAHWRGITHETVRLAAQVSMAELLLSGCTTTSDHFYIFPKGSDARVESVLEAADTLGMRIHACRGSMSVGQSRGGLPPDDCVQSEKAILADSLRVAQAHHDPDPLAMRRIDLAPCSPFSISPELLRDTAELARSHNLLLHTHAAETLDEQQYCQDRFGMRPIPYLAEHGWTGSDVYLAHCVHLDDDDIALLATTGTGVAHCPCSNMRLGSGIAPLTSMLKRGVKLGLGVDGSSSNDGGHFLAEARQALLLQRVANGAESLTPSDVFKMATVGGAAVLGRAKLGRLLPGHAADFAMFRKDDIALAGAVAQSPLGALTLCHVGRADRVVVAGRTVVQDGRLALLDEHKLAADLNRLVLKLRR